VDRPKADAADRSARVSPLALRGASSGHFTRVAGRQARQTVPGLSRYTACSAVVSALQEAAFAGARVLVDVVGDV
jgi:hypothetical protein